MIFQAFKCLQNWPKMAMDFKGLVENATDSISHFHSSLVATIVFNILLANASTDICSQPG